jgi:HK97 family phage major capsid protein
MDSVQTAALRRAADALRIATTPARSEAPRPDLARILAAAAEDRPIDGRDRELLEQAARDAGKAYDRYRLPIRWAWLAGRRDLSTAANGGGYLVESEIPQAFDALRPWSVTARAGITILEGLQGTVPLPVTSGHATAAWLASETAASTPSSPTVTSIALTPKSAAVTLDFSRLLSLLAPALAVPYISTELLRTLGALVDQAVISGSGGSGQPQGIVNTPNIGSESGTSLGQAGVAGMLEDVALADASEPSIAFLGTPTVRELLMTRERAAGSGYVWDNNQVAGKPAHVSTQVPAATLICADWSRVLLALWGDGFELEVTPFASAANFKAGVISARCLVSCDVAVLSPAAVSVASSIT